MKRFFKYIPALSLTIVFIIWTILVKTIDVGYISEVGYLGFYQINMNVNQAAVEFARANLFDKLTDVGLYVSIASVLAFGVIGIVQWVKRKSIKKVDSVLFVLLVSYVLCVAYYLTFEIMKINYSPLSTPEKLKASYPSTHILFFIVFMFNGLIALFNYVKVNKVIRICSYALLGALSVVYAVARLYSLNHWLSDVIGSILLASSIIALFIALKKEFVKEKEVEASNE